MTRRVKGSAAAEIEQNLSLLRKTAGLTQEQLAAAVSVTRKTINTVERGHYVPSTVLALKLAAALDTTVEEIFSLPE